MTCKFRGQRPTEMFRVWIPRLQIRRPEDFSAPTLSTAAAPAGMDSHGSAKLIITDSSRELDLHTRRAAVRRPRYEEGLRLLAHSETTIFSPVSRVATISGSLELPALLGREMFWDHQLTIGTIHTLPMASAGPISIRDY